MNVFSLCKQSFDIVLTHFVEETKAEKMKWLTKLIKQVTTQAGLWTPKVEPFYSLHYF